MWALEPDTQMLSHQLGKPTKPSRVVVLGAKGFISNHLQAWCERSAIPCLAVGKHDVDLGNPDMAQALTELLRADDVVVMTSSLTPDKGRDYRTLMANIRMGETVCAAMEMRRCAHFVYLSSDAVYDANKIPLDEDSTREPVDLYALSHIAREMMLGSALGWLDVPLCILRLTNIYGCGDTHNAYGPNRFVRSALTENAIDLFGKGEERRSHVFIDDAVELIGLAILNRSTGTLNVAVQNAVSFLEVAEAVIRQVGTQVRTNFLERKVPVIHKPYKPTQIFRFIYNLGRPIGPIVHRTFINSAVFSAFPGFRFTPLEEGLRAFIEQEKSALGRLER